MILVIIYYLSLFIKQVDSNLRRIPPTAIKIHRFVRVIKYAGTKSIPRKLKKSYLP